MYVVRATIDRMKYPLFMFASFCDLFIHTLSLARNQKTRVFRHSGGAFEFEDRVWELKAMPEFNPTTRVAREPSAVSATSQKEGNGIIVKHCGASEVEQGLLNRRHGNLARPRATKEERQTVPSLAYASCSNARGSANDDHRHGRVRSLAYASGFHARLQRG